MLICTRKVTIIDFVIPYACFSAAFGWQFLTLEKRCSFVQHGIICIEKRGCQCPASDQVCDAAVSRRKTRESRRFRRCLSKRF